MKYVKEVNGNYVSVDIKPNDVAECCKLDQFAVALAEVAKKEICEDLSSVFVKVIGGDNPRIVLSNRL